MAGHTFGKIMSATGMPSITLFIFFGLIRSLVRFSLHVLRHFVHRKQPIKDSGGPRASVS